MARGLPAAGYGDRPQLGGAADWGKDGETSSMRSPGFARSVLLWAFACSGAYPFIEAS